jgi:sugar transferase (PEP-CTERM/EpsH1 system associated)
MAKILFLAHRAPFPPNKGDKIRAYHILEHLAARHDVWLGAPADDPADMAFLPEAKRRYRDACFGLLSKAGMAANIAAGALRGLPLSVARFRHAGLAAWIDRVLLNERPDFVYVYSSAVAQYVTGRLPPGARLIVDFVDADAEKWREYAQKEKIPLRWVYAAEFRRLVCFDAGVMAQAEAGIVVSETERGLLAGFLPSGAERLHVIPNGVDVEYFKPDPATAPRPGDIVFTGTMDYLPNIDAVAWFAEEIFPLVRRECPKAVFRIVGARPSPRVLALRTLDGVEVTGAVPDIRPYLRQAAVIVAPLRIARGIQNKVLEGMAAARPVVASPEALDGIAAIIGRDILVGDGAEAFARAVCDVLTGCAPEKLGAAGRDFVLAHHQWSEQLRALDGFIAAPLTPGSG